MSAGGTPVFLILDECLDFGLWRPVTLDSRDRSGVDVRHRFHSCTSLSSCLSRYGKPRGTVLYSGPQSTAAILTPCGRFVWERGIRCGGEPSHQGRRRSPDTSSCFPRNSYFGFAATSCVCRNLVVSWRGIDCCVGCTCGSAREHCVKAPPRCRPRAL